MLSPKWVDQTLRARGVRGLSLAQIDGCIQSLDPQEAWALQQRLVKIAAGTEPSGDLSAIKAMLSQSRPDSDETAQSPSNDMPGAQDDQTGQGQPSSVNAPHEGGSHKSELRRYGHHVYGARSSLKVEIDEAKGHRAEAPSYTVQFEIAPKLSGQATGFDWTRKVAFQSTLRELPIIAALLQGYFTGPLKLSNHGPDRNKTLTIDDQGGHLFLTLAEGTRRHAIQIKAGDLYILCAIVLTALQLNWPHLDGHAQTVMLKRAALVYEKDSAA